MWRSRTTLDIKICNSSPDCVASNFIGVRAILETLVIMKLLHIRRGTIMSGTLDEYEVSMALLHKSCEGFIS